VRKRTSAIAIAALAALALTAAPASAAPSATAAAATQCPSTFRVLHNDAIGAAVLPRGQYLITVRAPGLTCAAATRLFIQFLSDYDGRLQKPWTVVAQGRGRASFLQNGQPGFSVAQTQGPPTPSRYGTVCPGNFVVINNDTIGPLVFPQGSSRIVLPPNVIVTCPQAINLFRQFLNRPNGDLPKNWRMKATTALFFKPGNSKRKRFRVDPAT
jgi:hypothetical protein